jgi:phenylacetaldehyde dehydrogenase
MDNNKISLLPSVQSFLQRQHGLYIDGGWRESSSDLRLTVYDPSSGKPIASTSDASVQDVDLAVRSAHKALRNGIWSGLAPVQREQILLRFADLLESNAEELAQLETLEQGKSINISRAFEVVCTVNWMRYAAGLSTKITGRTLDVSIPLPPGARYNAYTRTEPVGVVAGIVPWNFPLMIGMWKVMPALAAGCTIVIKPSENTPLTLLRMAELATEAGVPAGVFNVVTGSGSTCGQALTSHSLISKVSFTGSTSTGKAIARQAADRLLRTSLELGGKNPAIVLNDADPAQVVEGLMLGSFLNQGQVCAASSRIYVESGLYDQLVSQFEGAVKSMSMGPGLDTSAQINPVSSLAHQQKIQGFLADARSQGAELITGQRAPDPHGYYISPTLVLNPDAKLQLTHEEVFGPVLSLTRVKSAEEALSLANNSPYGLTASLWTQNLSAAMNLIPQIEAGTVWVNSHTLIDANMPFGGYKQSGIGRDFGVDWLDAYLETKSVCIRY